MKKTPGRPKLAKGLDKAEFVNIRFSADEAKQIQAAADQAKLKRSKWARNTLLEAARTCVTKNT